MSQPLITTNDIKDGILTDAKFATGLTVGKIASGISGAIITDRTVGYEKIVFPIAPNMLRNGGLDFNGDVPPTGWNATGDGVTVSTTGEGQGDPVMHGRPPTGTGLARRFERTSGSGNFVGFVQNVDLLACKYVRTNAGGGGPTISFQAYLSGHYLNNNGSNSVQAYAALTVVKNGSTVIAGPVTFTNNSRAGSSGTPWRPFSLAITVPDPGVTVSSLVLKVEIGQNGSGAGQYTYVDDFGLFSTSITG